MSHSTITHTWKHLVPAKEAAARFRQIVGTAKWSKIEWSQADAYPDEGFRLLGENEVGDEYALRFLALSCGNDEVAIQAIIDILHHEKVKLGLNQNLEAALRSGEHIMIDS